MTKKKKTDPTQTLSPQSVKDSDLANAENESVSFDVESQPQTKKKGIGESLSAIAKSGLWDDGPDEKRVETRGRKSKDAGRQELQGVAIAVLTLGLSLANFPQEVKPDESEIGIFSHHLTGIMIRHLPISGKMSADALDIIGLFAVLSTWYARVQPAIKAARSEKQKSVEKIPAQSNERVNRTPDQESRLDPISRNNPAAGAWLARAATTPESPN